MGKASTEQDPAYLLDSIIQLREDVYREGQETIQRWEPRIKRNSFLNSALNLSYYLSLRRRDIREIQEALMPWGLSSLGRLESRTIDNIDAVIASLCKITGNTGDQIQYPSYDSFMMGRYQLDQNSASIWERVQRIDTHESW